jgi:hypothetical protein
VPSDEAKTTRFSSAVIGTGVAGPRAEDAELAMMASSFIINGALYRRYF